MRAFAQLFDDLDSTTSTNEKVAALKVYFHAANPSDSMWAIQVLTGKISKRVITSRALRNIFLESTQYPEWLFEESYSHVGDTGETLSLLAHSLNLCRETPAEGGFSLTEWMEVQIPSLAALKESALQSAKLLGWWRDLTYQEIFILNKLITGAFRVGVSEKLVIRALAEVFDVPSDQVAHRLTGNVKTGADVFAQLISKEATELSFSQPYPFCLAHP